MRYCRGIPRSLVFTWRHNLYPTLLQLLGMSILPMIRKINVVEWLGKSAPGNVGVQVDFQWLRFAARDNLIRLKERKIGSDQQFTEAFRAGKDVPSPHTSPDVSPACRCHSQPVGLTPILV